MRAATDRRPGLFPLGLLLLSFLPGCARLQMINPLGGRPTQSSNPDSRIGSVRDGDTYASRLSEGTAPSGERVTLASQSSKTSSIPDQNEVRASGDEPIPPISIALQSPRMDEAAPRQSTSDSKPDKADALVRNVVAEARKAIDGISNYRVKLNRQERVGNALQPAEEVVLSLRREPLGVRIEWPEGPNKGREALYAAPPGDGLLHVQMPNSIVSRTALSPTSPLVLRNSRHPITEAGFDSIIAALESDLATAEHGRLVYRGIEKPEGQSRASHKLERINPEGETWLVYLDRQSTLPVLVVGTSKSGELLERYAFHDFKSGLPELADASAFDPDTRWGPSRGLFGRIARTPEGDAPVGR